MHFGSCKLHCCGAQYASAIPGGAAAGLPTPLPLLGGLPMRPPRLPLPVAGRRSVEGPAAVLSVACPKPVKDIHSVVTVVHTKLQTLSFLAYLVLCIQFA